MSFGSASCSTSSRQWSARPRPWSTWRVARDGYPPSTRSVAPGALDRCGCRSGAARPRVGDVCRRRPRADRARSPNDPRGRWSSRATGGRCAHGDGSALAPEDAVRRLYGDLAGLVRRGGVLAHTEQMPLGELPRLGPALAAIEQQRRMDGDDRQARWDPWWEQASRDPASSPRCRNDVRCSTPAIRLTNSRHQRTGTLRVEGGRLHGSWCLVAFRRRRCRRRVR